jgi:hypothetical protein
LGPETFIAKNVKEEILIFTLIAGDVELERGAV